LVLTAATKVHRELGPGLLESVYEKALAIELLGAGLKVQTQVDVPVIYCGHDLGIGFKADFVIEGGLVLELKSVDRLNDVHVAQLINYLKLMKIKRGFLINFNHVLLKHGIRRISI
jgi:GxxExxY protein